MTLAEEMENREYFAREEGIREGRESGLKEGLAKGQEALMESKREIALKLKASGMSPAEIAEITGLSEDEAAALE